MSIYGTMRTSISGMSAQTDRLSTIGDNIANVSTTGYKRSAAEFSTLVLANAGTSYESGGVETRIRNAISEQGTFKYSSSTSDLAVSGQGFFLVRGAGSDVRLTRAGAFSPNGDGELVNSAGDRLLGYKIDGEAAAVVVNGTAGLEPVRFTQLPIKAVASTAGSLSANLPADTAVIDATHLPSANVASSSYSARTSLVGFDSLGREVTLDLYFTKTAPDTWEVAAYDRAGAATNGAFPYSDAPLATKTVSFSSATGGISSASSTLSLAVPGGLSASIDLSKLTQFAGEFSIAKADMNGSAAVPISKYDLSEDGTLSAIYANGSRAALYRVPLGFVTSPDNLTPISGNAFVPSADSGSLQISLAGKSGLGSIISGALEQSTVDVASEMTAMIEAQRNYTANSRVFQTGADMTEVAVNLRS